MIYFLHGTDTQKSRAKLHELLSILSKKRPNSEIFKLTTENWSESQFDELLLAHGLFDAKYIVVLDGLMDVPRASDYVLERLSEMHTAEHPFLWLEKKVSALNIKQIEKHAEKIQEFAKIDNAKRNNDVFAIADGLLQKDKKMLWVSYLDLLNKGVAVEEIHGVLFWQVKNMLLATKANSQVDSGIAPFPYKKALSGARHYKETELIQMSSDLIEMTHKVRRGEGDLEMMVEKWVLSS